MSRATHRPLTTIAIGAIAAILVGLPACSDDEVVDRTPTSSSSTIDGETPLDRPGSHDASVTVHYALADDGTGPDPTTDALVELEDRLIDAIEPAGVGELDGDEFRDGELVVTIFGPELDALWAKVEPILTTFYARPAYAELRDGGPEQPAKRVELGPVPSTTSSP